MPKIKTVPQKQLGQKPTGSCVPGVSGALRGAGAGLTQTGHEAVVLLDVAQDVGASGRGRARTVAGPA